MQEQLYFAQGLLKIRKERVKLQNENRKASETGYPRFSRRDIPTGTSLDHKRRNVYEKANRKCCDGLGSVPDAAAYLSLGDNRFIILWPHDAHAPNHAVNGIPAATRKCVIKVRVIK